MTPPRPVLFLDIDRTLLPIHDTSTWDDYISLDSSFVGVPVPVSPRLLAAVGALPADIVYVTDWQERAHDWDALLGRRDTVFLERDLSMDGWWKLAAIDTWLTTHQGVTRFVHADDHLATDNRPELLADIARTHGCSHLAIIPEDGLTPEDMREMKEFLVFDA